MATMTSYLEHFQGTACKTLIFNPMAEGGPVCIFRSPKFLLKFVMGTTSKKNLGRHAGSW